MWKDLSPVVSECLLPREFVVSPGTGVAYLVTANATRVANTHGGAQSRRVTVRLYPSVAVRVGKNALNEREMTIAVMLHAVGKSTTLWEYGE